MKLALFLALGLPYAIPATSQARAGDFAAENETVVGDVVSGMQALQKPDGSITFGSKSGRIWLEDGRGMQIDDDERWHIYPAPADASPEPVSATDFSLYIEHYVGHPVRVPGGVVNGATIDGGFLSLPGRELPISFVGTPREDLRFPIETCTGNWRYAKCAVIVTGVVFRRQDGKISLRVTGLARPEASDPHPVAHGINTAPP